MKKTILLVSLCVIGWVGQGIANDNELRDQLQMIDQQIEQVSSEIKNARLREMKEELGTQQYLKTEWKDYTEQVEKAEKEEKQIESLKQQLKVLLKQKEEVTKKLEVQG